ncbi:PAS domain S-box protein [Candidatus Poribacteria bacterium]|nr:PAS domain S-box protein [Candidatus Poribacteria bacterium]
MNNSNFYHQIEVMKQRVDELRRCAAEVPAPLEDVLTEAFEELLNALEELHVAEEELREQNDELVVTRQAAEVERQRYQELFEFAPDGYLVTDTDGIIQEANRTAAILFNSHQDFLVGKPLIVFVVKEDRKAFHTQLTQLQTLHFALNPDAIEGASLLRLQRLRGWEVRLQPRDSSPFPAAISVGDVRNPQGGLVALRWLIRDITERVQAEQRLKENNLLLEKALNELKRAQERIIQQERLNAVGQMASGIAHDFNNALTPVLGFSELLLKVPI